MTTEASRQEQQAANDRTLAIIIYVFYAVGFFIPLTALIGVIMAHIKIKDTQDWLKSHLRFQIRTFYIGLGAIALGSILSLVVVGWFILIAWFIWAIIRIVVGLMQVTSNKPIDNPASWGTGGL